ncbi:hypothetical protein PC129_g12316 [Phytophthora cactorum]|uniref:Uncharacterized protein n=1 Tax=Phytophthora cactorum TaxID=29920 RepID=A0A329SLW1_9STRA|nr:hypothetical protein PC112_g18070 [Phytophthora cactorum]KAG2815154.1 hypothetical protein PC111_g13685 [Phytophthora cactorum]KAG2895845.1 hypothetical protein PC114_g15367 [Phytophthora cactorum]KAG2896352.1 hypothetical protein PC115_g17531 [Phytophthora cactorum]KAG2933400.1 hypothetical protein PC117_g12868 [Phytophthora cactorum]
MCNLIEGCFSVLKAKIKDYLSLAREDSSPSWRDCGSANADIGAYCGCIDLRLVNKMALHCQHAVAAAERMEDM